MTRSLQAFPNMARNTSRKIPEAIAARHPAKSGLGGGEVFYDGVITPDDGQVPQKSVSETKGIRR